MSRIEKALRKAMEEQHGSMREPRPPVLQSGDVAQSRPQHDSETGITSMSQPSALLPVDKRAELKIIAPELNQSPVVKAFRELRTKIGQQVAPGAIIMVTGVIEGSGSSFVAANLATAVAFDSMRTALLVDCNLRDPAHKRLIGDPTARGLTDYLEDEGVDIVDIIHPTGVERLRVVPTGQKFNERAEYFTLEKMRRLVSELAARYPDRQIILDVPPVGTAADAQILAGLCDHVLLVVPYGKVSESRLQAALKAIDATKLLGVVLNDEPTVPPIDWRGWLSRLSEAWQRFVRTRSAADKAGQ